MDGEITEPTSGGMPAPSDLFESLKHQTEHGAEYWNAREIMALLGYKQWRRFDGAIAKAATSCEQSGNAPGHHFASAGKDGGGSDYKLSRFACYLIAQNGDPRKPEIANAQKYFAIQTRRQELSDEAAADNERLELRKQVLTEFKALSGAAQHAGVQSRMFGVFHDAGYKGLYGGLGSDDIKRKKGIPSGESLMDRMNSTELAANQFRMTQTRDKLATVNGQQKAIELHESVGGEVRLAIKKIQGKMPEDIRPAEHIKVIEKRLKHTKPKLSLREKDALGLIAHDPKTIDDL